MLVKLVSLCPLVPFGSPSAVLVMIYQVTTQETPHKLTTGQVHMPQSEIQKTPRATQHGQ